MTDYPGCIGCIHNEDQIWELTNDWTQICHHEPNPPNLGAVRDFDETCEFREEE